MMSTLMKLQVNPEYKEAAALVIIPTRWDSYFTPYLIHLRVSSRTSIVRWAY